MSLIDAWVCIRGSIKGKAWVGPGGAGVKGGKVGLAVVVVEVVPVGGTVGKVCCPVGAAVRGGNVGTGVSGGSVGIVGRVAGGRVAGRVTGGAVGLGGATVGMMIGGAGPPATIPPYEP